MQEALDQLYFKEEQAGETGKQNCILYKEKKKKKSVQNFTKQAGSRNIPYRIETPQKSSVIQSKVTEEKQ